MVICVRFETCTYCHIQSANGVILTVNTTSEKQLTPYYERLHGLAVCLLYCCAVTAFAVCPPPSFSPASFWPRRPRSRSRRSAGQDRPRREAKPCVAEPRRRASSSPQAGIPRRNPSGARGSTATDQRRAPVDRRARRRHPQRRHRRTLAASVGRSRDPLDATVYGGRPQPRRRRSRSRHEPDPRRRRVRAQHAARDAGPAAWRRRRRCRRVTGVTVAIIDSGIAPSADFRTHHRLLRLHARRHSDGAVRRLRPRHARRRPDRRAAACCRTTSSRASRRTCSSSACKVLDGNGAGQDQRRHHARSSSSSRTSAMLNIAGHQPVARPSDLRAGERRSAGAGRREGRRRAGMIVVASAGNYGAEPDDGVARLCRHHVAGQRAVGASPSAPPTTQNTVTRDDDASRRTARAGRRGTTASPSRTSSRRAIS